MPLTTTTSSAIYEDNEYYTYDFDNDTGQYYRDYNYDGAPYLRRKLTATSALTFTHILAAFINAWCILVVKRNEKIAKAVRLYFYADNGLRIVSYGIYLSFAPACTFTFYCIPTNTVGFFINRLVGYIRLCVELAYGYFTLGLSINRFFAFFNDGLYYHYVESYVKTQATVIIVLPYFLMVPVMFAGEGFYYDPKTYGWYTTGNFWTGAVIVFRHYEVIVKAGLMIILDFTTAVTIRRKMRKSSVKRVDKQIMKQIVFGHAVTLVYSVGTRVLDNILYSQRWFQLNNFTLFWFIDFPPSTVDILRTGGRVYYMRKPTEKPAKVAPKIDVKANTGNNGTTTSIAAFTRRNGER